MDGLKADLHRYLQAGREALLWKLEGLGELDARRPLTPTGTNLLGIVKHVAVVEAGYLGTVFGRPFPEPLPGYAPDSDPLEDMWATAEESREDVIELYRRVWQHGDATLEALELDAPGHVPWWGDAGAVTLQRIVVHLIAETQRHAGHADVVRELVDGSAGLREGGTNLPDVDWAAHRAQVEAAAREAAARHH